jgi:hypothetical protein
MRRKLLNRAFLAAAVPLVFLSFIFLVGGCPAPGGGKGPDDPVEDDPILAVTPGALDFDISTDVRSIEVKNIGDGTLKWWVGEESCDFADCEPCGEDGLLPGETTTVQVSVDRLNLPKNADPPICDEIKIESNGGECVLTLSVAVDTSIPGQDKPVLAVTPSALDFDISTNERSIEVKNIGDGTLKWWVGEESCDFADCEPCGEDGLLPGETTTVQVWVDRLNLPKPPIGSIKIESNGGECVLTLSVAVDTNILLKGVVKEKDSGTPGTPIVDAVVTAEWQEGTPPDPVQSGVDGGYSMNVESSMLTISAEKTGYHFDTIGPIRFTIDPPDHDDPKPHIVYDIEMTRY